MEAAHAAGIVHRDLTPANIMLEEVHAADFVKVIDFGLSALIGEQKNTAQQLTSTGAIVGSVHYMSPEQCKGGRADQRCDIYSPGCVLYQMITGVVPFQADNPVALIQKHCIESAAPISSAIGEPIPPELEQLN